MGLWIKIGSRHETDLERGYTHFLEHMLFKGTQKRTSRELAEEIERVGGFMNAATSREYTYFYTIVMKSELSLGLDLLSDMIIHSKLSDDDTKSESSVILEEMKSYEDNPEEFLGDYYYKNIFPDSTIGLDIIGNKESISSATSLKIKKYYEKYYTPGRMILAVVGDFEKEYVLDLVNKYFQDFQKENSPTPAILPVIKSFSNNLEKRKLEQINFILGAEGFSKEIESGVKLNLLNALFGQNTSSRLFQKIREEKGLCYSISTYASSYTDLGIFSISCGTSHDKFLYCVESIMNEVKELKKNGITRKELLDAKANQKGSMAIGYELPENKMIDIAMQEFFYGRYYSFEDRYELIGEVTLDQMNELIQKIFSPSQMHLSAIGNLKQKEFKAINTQIS
jgi:predicted Zn-dependent peptidase